MRIRLSRKAHLPVLLFGVFCGAAVVLGAQALSKANTHEPGTTFAKSTTTVPKSAPPAAREAATTSNDASDGQNSWTRWPSLTDF